TRPGRAWGLGGCQVPRLDFPGKRAQSSELNSRPGQGVQAGLSETFALLLAYDGAAFHGWQRQPGMPTVQAALEEALRALLGRRCPVQGASRTDAGVHALGQVASFRSGPAPEMERLRLPCALRLLRWSRAHPSFHARASAIGKRYRYDLRSFLPGNPDWNQ